MDVAQVIIMIFGGIAIWMMTRKEEWSRWGYLIGLLGQPFWVYSTLKAEPLQWGILVLSLWYTYAYGQGVWFHIIRHKSNLNTNE